ncbi:sigma-70 family RNA polymerase sigma factor [Mucilaginibacter sp. RS28]|uniref:Sigma-70 family RNA polymerase sigma factor n=1 Tax=Mucilaginibacter straminoryzae TaxID=2932774 RepID=A0A9X2BAP3_9SPHI|nr:sigma-70 family RNA polymerase sigma factor [Mucilaginibacter straminoryzae]MCJ8210990.1 sigma-70 family RNA polymerase sigma factor [Mucilaginibacter straminoryzae]
MGEAELKRVIEACLKQDRKQQKMLYKAYYGFAMSICIRYAGNRYEAAEIMNQGFLKVFTNLHKYDPQRPFMAWLGRIMINASVDYYRSNLKIAYQDDLEKAEHISDDNLPDQKLLYEDLIAMVQKLPQAYRTVFNLYAIEGYTHEEIAAALNISTGTSKSNLFKAREKLRRMIAENGIKSPGSYGEMSTIQVVAISNITHRITFVHNEFIR